MATTRTAGITIDGIGRRTINKEYRGIRVFLRLGAVCQEHAEHRLAREIERLEWEVERRAHARPLFSDCANRFLAESKYKRTKATIAWHVAMLLPYVGDFDVRKVHDDTRRPFIDARLAKGKSPITINRTLEVVRTILNQAARAYRDGPRLAISGTQRTARKPSFRLDPFETYASWYCEVPTRWRYGTGYTNAFLRARPPKIRKIRHAMM